MNMTTDFQTIEAKSLAPLDSREELIDEVWRGLRSRPRSLVPWMLYDAEGSRLLNASRPCPDTIPSKVFLIAELLFEIIIASQLCDGNVTADAQPS